MIYSVIIPTKDGAETLPALLAALSTQKTEAQVEIVAVDSGSRDESVKLLQNAGARVIEIEPSEFGHGKTRNLGISESKGEFLFLLSQDAVPGAYDYLDRLRIPLRDDEKVAASFAKQLPRAGADPLEKLRWKNAPMGSEEPHMTGPFTAAQFDAMDPDAQRAACEFHSAACCIRRSVWNEIPLPDVDIGEDVAWARQILRSGYKIAYEPWGFVFHSHHRPLSEEADRIAREAALEYEIFGRAPVTGPVEAAIKSVAWALGDAAAVALGRSGSLTERVRAARRAARFARVRAGSLYKGYKKGKKGS